MALAGSEKSYSWTFFIISQILIVLALYSLYDEGVVRRPWKNYQYEFNSLQQHVAESEMDALKKQFKEQGTDKKIKDLQLELEKAQIAREGDEYVKTTKAIKKKQIEFDDFQLKIKFDKSILDSLYYEYKHALQSGHSYEAEQKKYEDLFKSIQDRTVILNEKKAEIVAMQDKLKAYDDRVKELEEKITEINKPLVDAQTKIDNITYRPIEVKQIVVEDFGKGGNINWGRVDRCLTCHVGSDRPGFEDVTKAFKLTVAKDEKAAAEMIAQKPEIKDFVVTEAKKKELQTLYGTHPRTQELLAKHPVEQFGCTSCHGGDGRGLIIKGKVFGEGDKAHAFHHHAVEPMLRGPQMESNCLACHKGNHMLSGAPNLTKGMELFVQLGCQNCHAVDGYDKLFRVGPELNKVGSKVQTNWLVDWIRNPFAYMPNSRMPNFKFSDDEVVAVASYLLSQSDVHQYKNQMALNGSAANGEKLFNTVGCLGCHSAKSDPEAYSTRSRASNLSRISAKVQSASWIYDWIKNPKNYSEHARMPSLRLTDTEASDITAYLMSQNQDYKNVIAQRSGDLAKRVDPKNQELLAHGKQIVANRGCYSCHLMKGFENGERIGPNLSAEALKEAFEFDFGDSLKKNFTFKNEFGQDVRVAHVKETPGELTSSINARARQSLKDVPADMPVTNLAETWQGWIRNKLKYPLTIYKHERAELKMPSFNLSESELDSLLVFIKGLTNRNVPYNFNAAMRTNNQAVIAGQQIVSEKNCLGCHAIYEFGGEINPKLDHYNHQDMPSMQYYPPELTQVGQKIRPEWLSQYLQDPSMPYRPAVYVRMPTFGFDETQTNTLLDFFAGMSHTNVKLTDTNYNLDPLLVSSGQTLASNEAGFACFACHLLGGKTPGPDPSMWAPDWVKVRARLQPDFIPHWIQNPPAFQKFAIMPPFLDSPESALPGILDGKADKQLEALKAYILSVGDKRSYNEMKKDYSGAKSVAPAGATSAEGAAPAIQ